MRLVIGVIGVIFCIASVILLGLDLSVLVTSTFQMDSRFHMTEVLELMRTWMPDTWTRTVNYINTQPEGEFKARLLEYAVSIPATVIGVVVGLGLVMIGFRIRRYRY